MSTYALVRDGVVVNVIDAEDEAWVRSYCSDNGYEAVSVDEADHLIGHGFVRDEETGKFEAPLPEETADDDTDDTA